MRKFKINDPEKLSQFIQWLRNNGYSIYGFQYAWDHKEGFSAWFLNEIDRIEVHTRIKEIQDALIGYKK